MHIEGQLTGYPTLSFPQDQHKSSKELPPKGKTTFFLHGGNKTSSPMSVYGLTTISDYSPFNSLVACSPWAHPPNFGLSPDLILLSFPWGCQFSSDIGWVGAPRGLCMVPLMLVIFPFLWLGCPLVPWPIFWPLLGLCPFSWVSLLWPVSVLFYLWGLFAPFLCPFLGVWWLLGYPLHGKNMEVATTQGHHHYPTGTTSSSTRVGSTDG